VAEKMVDYIENTFGIAGIAPALSYGAIKSIVGGGITVVYIGALNCPLVASEKRNIKGGLL
jgi:hypothetical protein